MTFAEDMAVKSIIAKEAKHMTTQPDWDVWVTRARAAREEAKQRYLAARDEYVIMRAMTDSKLAEKLWEENHG